MKFLLDTNVLLFAMTNDKRLGDEARRLIAATSNAKYFSVVSVWEVGLKHSIKSINMPIDAPSFVSYCLKSGAKELLLESQHVYLLNEFQELEVKDPFDQILMCQAKGENMHFLTCDKKLMACDNSLLIDARK